MSSRMEPERRIAWTEEARRRVEGAPPFVRPGIWKLMERRARERGRDVITSEFLTEIRNESMLRVAKSIRGFGFEELTLDAFEVAKAKMRKLPRKLEVIEEIKAFLGARTQKNDMVLAKFRRYLEMIPERGLPWTEEALARLQRAPAFVRALARAAHVTPDVVEHVGAAFRPPAAEDAERAGPRADAPLEGVTLLWTAQAEERLRRIPIPAVRRMVIQRVETEARALGLEIVDRPLYDETLG